MVSWSIACLGHLSLFSFLTLFVFVYKSFLAVRCLFFTRKLEANDKSTSNGTYCVRPGWFGFDSKEERKKWNILGIKTKTYWLELICTSQRSSYHACRHIKSIFYFLKAVFSFHAFLNQFNIFQQEKMITSCDCCPFFRPVIITDVVNTWPASKWTTEFFNLTYGNENVATSIVEVKFKLYIYYPCYVEISIKSVYN